MQRPFALLSSTFCLPPSALNRTERAMRGEYLLILLSSLLSVVWLDRLARLGVFRQGRRLALALVPTTLVILVWDLVGVERWGWSSNGAVLLGPYGLGGRVPLEEFLFPLVVGACAVTLWELIGKRLAEVRERRRVPGGAGAVAGER